MLTEDLNVYRSMYRLLMQLMDARLQFSKDCKYIVGDKMIDRALECITLIHYANEDRRQGARAMHLEKFLLTVDILKTLIMVCRDRRQFRRDSLLAEIFILVADVEKQASAWRKSAS
jgi:hypothetical protein